MGKLIFILIVSFLLFACSTPSERNEETSPVPQQANDGIVLKKSGSLSITGDFDGDKKTDTIIQHLGSKYLKRDLDSIPDPLNNHWDVVTNWHFNHGTELYITMNQSKNAALHLGPGQGLYCLINIGDNNSDKKDEIALVVDQLDVSSVNSCKIFSVCDGEWKLLKQFGVHEKAFNYTKSKPEVFSEIKNYLEYINRKWVYQDYLQTEFMNEDTIITMETLKLDKCK